MKNDLYENLSKFLSNSMVGWLMQGNSLENVVNGLYTVKVILHGIFILKLCGEFRAKSNSRAYHTEDKYGEKIISIKIIRDCLFVMPVNQSVRKQLLLIFSDAFQKCCRK